ncbi:MAG: hypothetical protein ACLSA6_17965 [Holdemania massiliensis]
MALAMSGNAGLADQNKLKFQPRLNGPQSVLICLSAGGFAQCYHGSGGEGVVFAACRNALRAQSIAPETLIEKTTVVPAGVVELAQKQQAGFAYIKP